MALNLDAIKAKLNQLNKSDDKKQNLWKPEAGKTRIRIVPYVHRKDNPFLAQVDVAEVPELKAKPKKALIAVVTALATGFLLLLFVFIRNALRNAEQDPESKEKLSGLKKLFRKQLSLK